MNLSILQKQILFQGLAVALVVAALSAASGILNSQSLDRQALAGVDALTRTAEFYLEQQVRAGQAGLKQIATSDDAVAALISRDDTQLASLAKRACAAGLCDALVFFRPNGDVLARGGGGSNPGGFEAYAARLRAEGATVDGLARLDDGTLWLINAMPVLNSGEPVGSAASGRRIDGNLGLVDTIKGLTGCEVTLFNGDKRVATTLEVNGTRAMGTVLNDPRVIGTVLERGERVAMDSTVLGAPYAACYAPLRDHVGRLVGMVFLGSSKQATLDEQRLTLLRIVLTGAAIGLVLVAAGWWLAARISRPILRAVRFAESVSHGDLDATITTRTRGEIGELVQALNAMAANLKRKTQETAEMARQALNEAQKAREAMHEAEQARARAEVSRREGMLQVAERLADMTEVIAAATRELARMVEQASEGAGVQSERVHGAAASMEQARAAALEVAQGAEQAAEMADQAKETASRGASTVAKAQEAIRLVRNRADDLRRDMAGLADRTRSIDTIMTVIADIADQTNLLALNAAIEAARAGEAGRGFAVVAGEVRKLAEKTMQATREVDAVVTGIQTEARRNAQAVEHSVSLAAEADTLAAQSGGALRDIVQLVEHTAEQVRSMAVASNEQSTALAQISASIEDINQVSRRTSTTMARSTTTVTGLAEQAQALQGIIAVIRG